MLVARRFVGGIDVRQIPATPAHQLALPTIRVLCSVTSVKCDAPGRGLAHKSPFWVRLCLALGPAGPVASPPDFSACKR